MRLGRFYLLRWKKEKRLEENNKNQMSKKITIKKVLQFIEGNAKMFGDYIDLLPHHEKEQVIYRSWVCRDECMEVGYCKHCGCSVPGKLYVKESCNDGELFPDMMNESAWEAYKEEKKINMDEILH